ncbi:hypothetical protein CsSME_00010290 [Camellia sinensis var. sinensis]
MEDNIVGNLNSTVVITIEGGRRRLRYTQIIEKTAKPNKLSSSMSFSTILSFDSRASNNRIAKKHTEIRGGLVISNITSLIRISIGHQV